MTSLSLATLEELPPKQQAFLILQELQRRTETPGLDQFYPDKGPLRRELYEKSVNMLFAGRDNTERYFFGGNRTGKSTSVGGYETALHMTGLYPDWWEGHTINKPILAWAAGTKGTKVRDSCQKFLLGNLTKHNGFTSAAGGLIPGARIKKITRKTGVADAVDQVFVKHKLGWENTLTFKSYEEGRTAFESEAVDWIWLDEAMPQNILTECIMRLITTRGRLLATFTPVEGLTPAVIQILKETEFL